MELIYLDDYFLSCELVVAAGLSQGLALSYPMSHGDVAQTGSIPQCSQVAVSPYYTRGTSYLASGYVSYMIIDGMGRLVSVNGSTIQSSITDETDQLNLVWTQNLPANISACPVYDSITNLILAPSGSHVYALNADNGTIMHSFDVNANITAPLSFFVSNNVTYLLTSASDGSITATSTTNWTSKFTATMSNPIATSPVTVGGYIIVVDAATNITAFDMNGTAIWSTLGNYTTKQAYLSASVSLGLVFVAQDSGTLTALNVVNGQQNWSVSLGLQFQSSVSVWSTTLYSVLSDGSLRCFDATSGVQMWRAGSQLYPAISPIINYDSAVLVTDLLGNVNAFWSVNGNFLWKTAIGLSASLPSSIVVGAYGTMIYASSISQPVIALIKPCVSLPPIVATLQDRSTLTFLITFVIPAPNSANFSSIFLFVNGARVGITATPADRGQSTTSYRAPFGSTQIQFQCVTNLIPGLGIKSSLLQISAPDPSELSVGGSVTLGNITAATLALAYIQQDLLIALCSNLSLIELTHCSISSTSGAGNGTIVSFVASTPSNVSLSINEINQRLLNGSWMAFLNVRSYEFITELIHIILGAWRSLDQRHARELAASGVDFISKLVFGTN